MEGRTQVMPSLESVAHVSWGAIFSGTFIVLVVEVTLALLGLGIGLSSISPSTSGQTMGAIGTGSAVWWVISAIIALFCGGWVTSRLAGLQRPFDGVLHGLITWAFATLIMIWLLSSAVGAVIGGSFSIIRNVMMASSNVAASQPGAAQNLGAQLQGQAQQLQGQAANPQTQQQIQQRAQQVGAQVAKGAGTAAIGGFIMLILSAISAGLGGAAGRIKGPVSV
jgi:hypothetical protein